MKTRNYEDIKKDLSREERLKLIKSSPEKPEPPQKPSWEEKLVKAIDAQTEALKKALDKPIDNSRDATLMAVMDALKDIKGIVAEKPKEHNKRIVIVPVGGDREDWMAKKYEIEVKVTD